MLVRDWMTPDPKTITPDTPVLDAIKMLKDQGYRRLPVVENGKLVGIVTDKDLKDAMPSKATTLSVWELNYLLSKLTVAEVMAKPVITVEADEPLEEAALLMEEYRIGGLPVLANGELVGIITITDVLKAFIEVMGLREGGLRLTLDVADEPGALERLGAAVKPSNIVSVATAGRRDGKRVIVIRVTGEEIDTVVDRLKAAGEQVLDVRETKPRSI
ncbi:CBS and ACT domain-containing protein [Oceanithermus sp.]